MKEFIIEIKQTDFMVYEVLAENKEEALLKLNSALIKSEEEECFPPDVDEEVSIDFCESGFVSDSSTWVVKEVS